MTPSQCTSANDQLASAITTNPTRFAGLAGLPMPSPSDAAAELNRCMTTHAGFVGALVDNRAGDTHYDGASYLEFWAAASRPNCPVYLHPTWASDTQLRSLYTGNFPHSATLSLAASGWGWHSDVALHLLRLFASGLFDTFPDLTIILGHFGEMIPYVLEQIILLSPRWGERRPTFGQVYDETVWVTTSGVWSVDPLATVLRNTKVERVMFSVDWPFASVEDGRRWWAELEGEVLRDGDTGLMGTVRGGIPGGWRGGGEERTA